MLAKLLKQTNLVNRLRGARRHDADEAMKPIRKELRRLAPDVEQLQDTAIRAARGDKSATQLRLVAELNTEQRDRFRALPALLNEAAIASHVRAAVALDAGVPEFTRGDDSR